MVSKKGHKPGPLGVALKALRDQAGLSQRALHLKSQVHYVTIAQLESGARQDADTATIKKLAEALGARPSELLDAGVTIPASPVVSQYLAGPFAQIDRPSEEEAAWLRSLSSIWWRGIEPSERAVHHILEARRAGKSAT